MDIEKRIKKLELINRNHAKDLKALKAELDGKKKSTKVIHDTINRMIVRTESQWSNLRGLGRFLTKKDD
jgi:hypothetical protein